MSELSADQKYQLAFKMANILEAMLVSKPVIVNAVERVISKPPPSPGIMDDETEEMLNKMIKEQLTVEE